MKNLLLTLLILIVSFNLYPQTDCNPPTGLTSEVSSYDVRLTWIAPTYGTFQVLNEHYRTEMSKEFDLSPTHKEIVGQESSRAFLDLQFSFPTYFNMGEAGVACDGNYFYTTTWNDTMFFKYGLDGTFIDTLVIPGVNYARNLVYCETDGYIYATTVNNPALYAVDFNTLTVIDTIPVPYMAGARATAYNPDLDVFYTNNWSTDIIVIDRVSEQVVDTLPLVGPHGSYYGFAYDNYTENGPYLWGFSQENNGVDLVQMSLPTLTELSVTDLTQVLQTPTNIAGGLYIIPDIVDTTVTLGGLLQNDRIFGLELTGSYTPPLPPTVSGYNIFRDDTMINIAPVTDTVFIDFGLIAGTYNYHVTALYSDTSGALVCESGNSNIATAVVTDPDLIIGGNIFAGDLKLESGIAYAYNVDGDNIQLTSEVEIDELGYYFFLEFAEKDYYIYTAPSDNSGFANDYLPTYFGDVYHWEDAPMIHLNQNLYNQDINLVKIQETTGTGNGSISGTVYNQSKNFMELPASEIMVILLNAAKECIDVAYTDDEGNYIFDHLENGSYYLLCEITGKETELTSVLISTENQSVNHLNFMIKNDQIIMGIDNDLHENIAFISSIYPNPVSDIAHIEISVLTSENLKMVIYDITGKVIYDEQRVLKTGNNIISIDITEMATGINIIRFDFENGNSLTRKFLIN